MDLDPPLDQSKFAENAGVRRWILKGAAGIMDQGVYSGSNFLLNIILARWLSAEAYGGYSVAFSLFLFFSTAQVALIAEPMSIFGASSYADRQGEYLNLLLRAQWAGSFLVWVLLLPSAFLVREPVLRSSLLGMAISLPFIFGHWYVRRACYLESRSGLALASSVMYGLSLSLLVFVLKSSGLISIFIVFLAMGAASAVASLSILAPLRVAYWGGSTPTLNLRAVFTETWAYGRSIWIAYAASWVSSMAYPLFIAIALGTQSAAGFRAIQNIFLPLQQGLAVITLLALPWLTKQRYLLGEAQLFKGTRSLFWFAVLGSGIYCLLAVVFRSAVMLLLYRTQFYASFAGLIPWLAVAAFMGALPLTSGLGIRVLGEPEVVLWSKIPAALIALLLGLPLMWQFGMEGAVLSLVVGATVEAMILLLIYIRLARRVGIATSTNPATPLNSSQRD